MVRCRSGLTGGSGKSVSPQGGRGFKSHPHRLRLAEVRLTNGGGLDKKREINHTKTIMRTARLILRGLFIPILALVFFLFLALGKTHAQTNQYFAPNTNPDVPRNQHTLVQSVVIETLATGMCLLSGYDVLNPTHQCLGIDPYTSKLGFAPLPKTNEGKPIAGGALGGVASMIGSLYTHPPVSSIEYVHYMAGNFGFGEKAYAQAGYTGYSNLYDLRLLWRNFRNVAYGIMVIAFVLIGIAVMLRVRIDPRTVMTVQNQIPKIIIGILLITFSYAIAGFMVDLMWFMTYVGIDSVTSTEGVKEKATQYILESPIYFFDKVFEAGDGRGLWSTSGRVAEQVNNILVSALATGESCIETHGWFNLPDVNLGDCLGSIFDWIGQYVWRFIILAAFLIALIRLWFTLLKAYAFIILDVIAAPLWIAAGAIPGSSLNFSSWFRHITAHLLLFPAAATLITLAATLEERFTRVGTENFFTPPLLGNPANKESFIGLIVLAIIMMLPELLTILRDALRSKPLPYSAAVGAGVAAGAGLVGGIVGGGIRTTLASRVKSPEMGKPAGWRGALRQTVKF